MLAVATNTVLLSRQRMRQPTHLKGSSQESREIGEALRSLRDAKGLTQDEAAGRMGVTRTAWQNYEGGRSVVLRTDQQSRMAAALGATREELMAVLRRITDGQHSALAVHEPATVFAGPGRAQAIFPTGEGDLILSYPAALSAGSKRQLKSYLSIFLTQLEERGDDEP